MRFRSRIKEWLYGSCPGFAGSFPYHGTRIYFPKRCEVFHMTCRQGTFERDNVNLLCLFARRGDTVLDVGANIGLMAAPILRRCPEARVVSFEPSPATLAYLHKTLATSPYAARWCVVPKALCDQEGTVDFYTAAEDRGAYDGLADTERGGPTHKVTVQASTLDAEWLRLGRPTVSVIKIDVEGAELRVLKGASRCITVHQPPILIEWSSRNLTAHAVPPSALLEFAEQTKYTLHSVPGLVRISTEAELALHMKTTESFLLWSTSQETRCVTPH